MTAAVAAPKPADEAGRPQQCRVGVLGLGYAGLPQAVAFAEAGHPVTGVDIDPAVTGALRAGRSPVDTVTHDDVRRLGRMLSVGTDIRSLADCSAVLVCVPTPLDRTGRPDLGPLRSAARAVAATLSPGQLVIIESTVHPGVTDSVVKPILETSGLVCGVHFNLAFAPERVDPGNPVYTPTNTSKVVGGYTSVCVRRASELYHSIIGQVHVTKGLREAEAAKILENTYRQVNLALIHEFAEYCGAQGIDVVAAIDAAATKPFGFQPFYPGVGVGGHCIPVDPMYLAHSGREHGTPLRLVELAQQINDARPGVVARRCVRLLSAAGHPADRASVLVLGVTYKPDVADIRNSPVGPLVRELGEHGVTVSYHDPLIPEYQVDGRRLVSVPDLEEAIREADLVLVAQRHSCYDRQLLAGAKLLHVADGRTDRRELR